MSDISREDSLSAGDVEKKQVGNHVNPYYTPADDTLPEYQKSAIGKDGLPDAESGEITADTTLETTLQLVTKTLDSSEYVFFSQISMNSSA